MRLSEKVEYTKRKDVIEAWVHLMVYYYFEGCENPPKGEVKKAESYFREKAELDFPSEDVKPVVHAIWVPKDHDGSQRVCTCSACGEDTNYVNFDDPYPFCPNCGADMNDKYGKGFGKVGTWQSLGHRIGYLKHPWSEDFKCSICGYEQYTLLFPPPDVCPKCGARMAKPV